MATLDFDSDDLFGFEDTFHSVVTNYDKKTARKTKEVIEDERRFLREELAPMVLSEDRKHAENHEHLSWEMLRLAGRNGRLSSFIPKFMGGSGKAMGGAMMVMAEEQAAVDGAYSGMLGGQGLGLVALMMTFNMRVLSEVIEKTVANENQDKPYVIDCAITEPTAGTDVEEVELYPKAKLMCQAKRVPGGAVLNGRKVFISTGHMATDHVVLMPFDLKDPVDTYGCFLVPSDADGFSLGRMERKMGQRAGPASELIFDDCFIPTKNIIMDCQEFPEFKGQFQVLLHAVLGVTRIAVGAWSTGTARAALERALYQAKRMKHKGRTLIHQQWAQTMLTNMFMNVMMARSVYLEAQFCLMNNMQGLASRDTPEFMNSDFMVKFFKSDLFKKFFHSEKLRKRMIGNMVNMGEDEDARVQFMASLAKVVGSDMAMENCHLAIEFLSKAGIRHDQGVEKIFRDAKLLQIFEGTNQLNRLNIFKHHFCRRLPGVDVF